MKTLLHATTALVAVTLVAGMAQAAEPLKVGVSGNMQQWFGIVDQESDGAEQTATERDFGTFGINTDTEIDFGAKTTLDNGTEVEVRVEIDTFNDNLAIGVDEEWLSLGGKWGKIYAGAKESTNHNLHNEAVDYGIGYDNVDLWVVSPVALQAQTFGSKANPIDGTSFENITGVDDIASIQYISPKVMGFQAGATYAPAPVQLGAHNTPIQATAAGAGAVAPVKDYMDATLAYSREYAGINFGADVGYARFTGGGNGASAPAAPRSARLWNTGAKVAYKGFSVGGAYLRYMEPSKEDQNAVNALDGHTWNAGAAYDGGIWGVSYLYFNEEHQGDPSVVDGESFGTHLLSARYGLGPGVDLKSSLFYAEYDDEVAADVNETEAFGWVTGVDVSF